jgi:hypothetical protein
MMDSTGPTWVPASLVRVRCFLNRNGMKVKPWLGPAAVLEGFHAALRSQTKNDRFWTELEQLLCDLANDMNQRIARRGWVVQNELLDQSTHTELLAQIREAIGIEGNRGLHPVATAMPQRAGALLLMLAAAIVVGCGGEAAPATGVADNGGMAAAAGGVTSGGSFASGGTSARTGGATGTGGSIFILTAPASGGARTNLCPNPGVASGLDPNQFAACNPKLVQALIPYDIESDTGKQLLECACLLNDAWQTGLADLFAGQSCDDIAAYFGTCGVSNLCASGRSSLPEQFDANQLLDNCMVTLYYGVRCD